MAMVAGVHASTTIFNASSPLILPNSDQTQAKPRTNASLLTSSSQGNSDLADRANIFTPAANISALAPSNASVILTEQAREKPIILQDPNPPLDTSSLGNLNILDELQERPLAPEAPANKQAKSEPAFTRNDFPPEDYFEPQGRSFTPQEYKTTLKAFDDAAATAAAPSTERSSYLTSTVDISA